MATLFCFSGCFGTLVTPLVSINECVASWDSQNNASSYDFVINDVTFNTTKTSFDIAPYLTTGRQSIKVKAYSNSIFISDSEYSTENVFYIGNTLLSTPTNTLAPTEDNLYVFSWDNVINADTYVIKIQSLEDNSITYASSESNSVSIKRYLTLGGSYNVSVRAVSYDYTIYAPSEYTDATEFVCYVPVDTPVVNNITKSVSSYYLSWGAVDNATSYRVTTLNGNSMVVNSTSANITGLLNSNTTFVFVQAIASGYNLDSAYSNGVSCFKQTSKQEYADTTLNFVGQNFDLVANDTDELKSITYYTLLYRIESIQFYIDYLNTNTEKMNAIYHYLGEYNEIKSINISITYNTSSMFTLKVSYGHISTPNLSATGNCTTIQNEEVVPSSYATTNLRSSTFDDFAIEDRTLSAEVFTSDQLYYVIQNGCKPVFASSSCPAKVVYDLAKQVLISIISNDMNDYQKVCAIFEWLTYNTTYDHNLLTLSQTASSATLSQYRGFYIEGVLLDNGQAVCDGIAKTFVLLCGLENIDCYKVSGLAGEGVNINPANGSSHAWNKVKIAIGEEAEQWYTVDCTWADFLSTANSGSTNYVETLSHSYFLVTDAEISGDHFEQEPDTNESVTDFDYFGFTQLGTSLDLYATNLTDLQLMLSYANDHNMTQLEFMTNNLSADAVRTLVNNTFGASWRVLYIGNQYVIYES